MPQEAELASFLPAALHALMGVRGGARHAPPVVAFVAAAIGFALTAALYAWLAHAPARPVQEAVLRGGIRAGFWLSAVALEQLQRDPSRSAPRGVP